jgi:tRNA(Ile)-lysidine synthase
MPSILERVGQTISRHNLIPQGGRVIAAVSGGSDSVALLHLLEQLSGSDTFELVGLIHLNHQLRERLSDEDEQFCRRLASKLERPIYVERVDIRSRAHTLQTSIENAARTARLDFFRRVAVEVGVDRVAVGHTRDDQAETFLLRVIRGAGTRGLSSVYPRFDLIVRPLLDLTRAELRVFLANEEISYREDESNRDVTIPRNRIRHELIPYLREHFSGGIVDVLAREASIAHDDADWLDSAANISAQAIVSLEGENLRVDIKGLVGLPDAIKNRVVLVAMRRLSGGRFIGFDHVDTFMRIVKHEITKASFPGHSAVRVSDEIVLSPGTHRLFESDDWLSWGDDLPVPGAVKYIEAGIEISAASVNRASIPDLSLLRSCGEQVFVDATKLQGALMVRNRRPGDVFQPLGLRGHKKLQDFFVDRKIGRDQRHLVPIVVDGRDRIIWVAGHTIENDFRVTEDTLSVIVLRLKELGESA